MKVNLVRALLRVSLAGAAMAACNLPLDPEAKLVAPPTAKDSETTSTVVVRVKANEGGTVADPSGTASLAIPPGALAADTDITLTVRPATDATAGAVYDFGPDGLRFMKPAALAIKADPARTGGKPVEVAIEEGGMFKAVPGSTYEGGTASAPIAHFTLYSVIFVGGKATLSAPTSCKEFKEKFRPCGGDPKGTWSFADLCAENAAIGEDPFKGTCPEARVSFAVAWHKDVIIDATRLTVGAGTEEVTSELNAPLTCVQRLSDVASCAAASEGKRQCMDAAEAGHCSCKTTDIDQEEAEHSTYTVEGNVLTITGDDGTVTQGDYCVDGDTLAYAARPRADRPDAPAITYILKRKAASAL